MKQLYTILLSFAPLAIYSLVKKPFTLDAFLVSYKMNLKPLMSINMYVFCISLGTKEAFDIMVHKLLLRKLDHFGIRGNTLNWSWSFLKGRLQAVKIPHLDKNKFTSSHKSGENVVLCGVHTGRCWDRSCFYFLSV